MKEVNKSEFGLTVGEFIERLQDIYRPDAKSCILLVDDKYSYNDEEYFPGVTNIVFLDENNSYLDPDYDNAAKFNSTWGFDAEYYDSEHSLRNLIFELNEEWKRHEEIRPEIMKVNLEA